MLMKYLLLGLLVSFTIYSCGSDESDSMDCGRSLIINEEKYQSIDDPDQSISLINSSIVDECLSLTLGFSGCDAEHQIDLVTDGAVAESFPVQVFFKLEDQNPQLCLAYFEQTFYYDLEELDDLLGGEPKARLIFPHQSEEIFWDRE